ncbi:fructosamine kinase family protein [Mucilaginibacter gynuensis]|uniref:Fructosamine kinase family protein n=1 Tax=Mucilaginibacter gynuensis TaxID=1302236 RepID=A0ABP8FU29_9SPHI
MPISRALVKIVEERLALKFKGFEPIGGGSINSTYSLLTDKGRYFVKTNSKPRFKGMFEAEARGLHLIADTQTIATPEVVLQDETDSEYFLLLEWIDTKRPDKKTSQLLGTELAAMHRLSSLTFGLDHDNYMGSLNQSNKQHNTWGDFFINKRLIPMVKLGVDLQMLDQTDVKHFDTLYKHLPELFDEEPPALIHGDLWGGNYIMGANNKPYLIDPAVSYGHREFDMAMTTLFGGFANEFYISYNEAYPLAKNWQQRIDLWNLYPLLVHVNIFGGSYVGQTRDALRQFV